ncbi:SDR family NAD(P)-dependent oxidoreductase [Leucobacter albus]|uniref:SDR family NAD(P)-dependent oxidoreductase n=1 Tax=Leucobacter albus TaxID=272210 RepID=A0ABW3TNJ4_9MICO
MSYRALITGASAGLGTEFARQLAALGVDLVLVARDAARLERLAHVLRSRYGVDVEVLAADLTASAALEAVAGRLSAEERPIDILINNAGFGVYAGFEASDITEERRLHELLSWVPLRLAHAAVPGMLERGSGWILNVASAAAFLPSGSYGSAKAAAVSLSRSLSARYRASGLRVTALCPGLLATEFHERMGEDHLPALPSIAWADTGRVAREGLRALYRGKPVLVSDWRYRLALPLRALLPDRLLERLGTTNDPGLR